jgi:hypothetical protein
MVAHTYNPAVKKEDGGFEAKSSQDLHLNQWLSKEVHNCNPSYVGSTNRKTQVLGWPE